MTVGIKHDKDKFKMSLVPYLFLESLAKVFTYGANKYKKDNWKYLDNTRLMDAAERHIMEYKKGNITDLESGLPHLVHAASNLAMIYQNKVDEKDKELEEMYQDHVKNQYYKNGSSDDI